jgi:hypothetical protein
MRNHELSSHVSPLRRHRIDVLQRARKLPVGPDRNDLRQLASGLRYLELRDFKANVQDRKSYRP